MRRLAPLLTLTVLVAACGGQERLTRAEYVRRADAICARYNRVVAGLQRPKRTREIVRFSDRTIAALDDALADERELLPPKQLEPLKRRWLAQAAKIREDIADLREAARRVDVAGINDALERGTRDDKRSNALARRLGLKVCSEP